MTASDHSDVLATAFSKALAQALPAILELVDRRLQAALDERATPTIGQRCARSQITSRLRDIAERRALAFRESVRRHRGIAEAELRATLEFSGAGRAWQHLPSARLAEAVLELDRMMIDAERLLAAVDRVRSEHPLATFKA